MNIKKKIVAVVVAAASALSLTSSVSAATGTTLTPSSDKTSLSLEATALMAIPAVQITWPTVSGVILNPYKMVVDIPTAIVKDGTKVTASTKATAVDYSILSPEMKFVNAGPSDIAISVSNFKASAQTVKGADGNLLDAPTASSIKFVTAAIKHETVKESTQAVTAGSLTNDILMFLEVATPVKNDAGKVTAYEYTGVYDSKAANQLIVGTEAKPAAKAKFFNVPAKGAANGETHVMICGDMSYNPTVPWSTIARTDEVNVSMVFDVVLATPQEIVP